MAKPKILVLGGEGINCESETAYAFNQAGGQSEFVHVRDLIASPNNLNNYQILVFPGGFSFGDDTGAGNALANMMKAHLFQDLRRFIDDGKLVLGICNGFQVLANLGLLPALDGKYGERQVALVHNDSARYIDRWVDLEFQNERSPWTTGLERMSLPIAHGEGKFYAPFGILKILDYARLVAARYVEGDMCKYHELPANPNGSLENIAAITDASGLVLGMMPHPERAIDFTHRPDWTLLREQYRREGKEMPNRGPSIQIFKNAIEYFK